MKAYGDLGPSEVSELQEKGGSLTVSIPDSIAKVLSVLPQSAEAPDAPGFREIAIPVLGDAEAMAAYGSKGDDLEARWIRTLIFVYRHGGKVFFKDAGNGTVETQIRFPERTPQTK